MDQEKDREIGRLAMRVEGLWWNAYYALPDSMADALLLGSIRMAVVRNSKERKEQFMALMSASMDDLVEVATGFRPDTAAVPRSAPENERSGNG